MPNDRPAGLGRHSARGFAWWDVNARISRTFSFGGAAGEGGAVISQRSGGDGGPTTTLVQVSDQRFGLMLYAQAYNLLNRINYLNFSGNVQSPFFAQPTSADPARRVELGVQFAF